MKRYRFRWFRKSIFAKFSLSFISVGLIPLFILSYVSLNTFSSYMERYTINNFEQMLLFAGKNVDDAFVKYNNMSKLMYSYGVEGKYGQLGEAIAERKAANNVLLTSMLDDFLRTVLYTDRHLKSAVFVFPAGNYQELHKENKRIDFRLQFPDPEWKRQLAANRQSLVVIPTHPETYFGEPDSLVLTFGRNLIDVVNASGLNGEIVGSLLIDVGISAFDEIFEQLELNPRDTIYVTDSRGTVLYSNKKELIGTVYEAEPSEAFFHLTKDIPQAGWKVIGDVYKTEMFSKIHAIKNTITLVIVLCMLSLIGVAFWFSRNLSNPIRMIMKHMQRVESGKLDTRAEVRSMDEVGMLARGFNLMTSRLQSYIEEVYVAQIKQKHAELQALKSQIRPHYLYNTLEAIRMSAVANDDDEVADMILSLSHQLKYVLDYGQETVTLLEEKTNIEQYFKLMVLRYGEHRLALDIRMDGELLLCIIPKLSIQPLLENAIYHGIMPKAGKGTIRITAERDETGERLMITVDDDGVGMEPGTLMKLREKLAGRHAADGIDGGSGIGVKNVHDRIVALYGAEYGIEVNSSPRIGTSVRMTIPYRKEVNPHDQSHTG